MLLITAQVLLGETEGTDGHPRAAIVAQQSPPPVRD
jgi:hypothetical protein